MSYKKNLCCLIPIMLWHPSMGGLVPIGTCDWAPKKRKKEGVGREGEKRPNLFMGI